MNVSFGVVIPVWNAELQLSPVAHEVLDVLSDLTPQFKLLIIDDASTDHTCELAHDLAKQFPQIRVVMHRRRVGLVESARRGVRHLAEDQVFIVPGRLPVDAAGLRRAWREFSELGMIQRPLALGGRYIRSVGRGTGGVPMRRWEAISRGTIHQRWQIWGIAERQAWTSRRKTLNVRTAETEEPGDGSSQRPDTVWQQRTAPLLPLRRTRTRLPRPLLKTPPR